MHADVFRIYQLYELLLIHTPIVHQYRIQYYRVAVFSILPEIFLPTVTFRIVRYRNNSCMVRRFVDFITARAAVGEGTSGSGYTRSTKLGKECHCKNRVQSKASLDARGNGENESIVP